MKYLLLVFALTFSFLGSVSADEVEENIFKLKSLNSCEKCKLNGANLNDANLLGANLQGANFSGVNLEGANLEGANLSESNLIGADLQGANFSGANLEGANLSEANLRGADLNKANLRGANLKYINLKYIKNPPKIIIDKLKKIRIENANTYNETCHMHTCYWFRVREVRDSRFPNDPVIGWHPQKRVADQQLKNPFYILRKNPFVVEFLTSWATTSHVCSNRDSDKLISCANFGPYNDEYPSNWEEDYPSTLDEFTYKFQKYIKWKKSSTYFHCSKQFPAIAYNILEEEVREIKVFQFQDWHHKNFKSALYFHFCHNKIVNSLNYISSVDFDYPSLAKELGYPQYVYNIRLPAPTFPSWDALVNFNK